MRARAIALGLVIVALMLLAAAIARTAHPLWSLIPVAIAAAVLLQTTCFSCRHNLAFRTMRVSRGAGRHRHRCPNCGCFL